MAPSNLKLWQWNAFSIHARKAELSRKLAKMTHPPQVICIQETWLTPTSRPFVLPGYDIERKDGGIHAGILTAVRNGVTYSMIEIDCPGAQVTQIKLNGGPVHLINLYVQPRTPFPTDAIRKHIERYKDVKFIILGDMNAYSPTWGADYTDTRGRAIDQILNDYNMVSLNPGVGTHLLTNGTTTPIDVTIASNSIATKCTWNILTDTAGSDHYPIEINVEEIPATEDHSIEKYNIKKADWLTFKHLCGQRLTPATIKHYTDEEDLHTRIMDAIMDICDQTIPKSHPTNRPKTVPYWTDKCQQAIKRRKAALKKSTATGALEDCIDFRKEKAACQRTIREAQTEHWQEYCNTLTDTTKLSGVWRMAKKVAGNNGHRVIPNITLNTQTYETAQEKAELFAETMAKVSSDQQLTKAFRRRRKRMEQRWAEQRQRKESPKNTSEQPAAEGRQQDNNTTRQMGHQGGTPPLPPRTGAIDNLPPKEGQADQHNQEETVIINEPFQLHELKTAIRTSKGGSAPGEDQITYEMVKHMPNSTLTLLLQLYNGLWKQGKLINNWKCAIIIPICKPGQDPHNIDSYRPISLTSVLCKLMERMVTSRLTWFVEKNHHINNIQAGFRRARCTIDQLSRLQDEAHRSISTGGTTQAILLDFSKAFDLLWREGLLHKLRKIGLQGQLYQWIDDFLSHRNIKVRVGATLSPPHKLENGTPQGSIISPLLFILMMSDFPESPDGKTQVSLYADDSAIWRSGKNIKFDNKKLQTHLDIIAKWCRKWGFKINAKKTVYILFSNKKTPANLDITVNNKAIPPAATAKFLGLTFDKRLTWKTHITSLVNSSKTKINLLRNLGGHHWGATKTALLQIYRALIRSSLEYGASLFYTASKYQLSRLDRIQTRCLRISCGAIKTTDLHDLQNECGEPPLELRRQHILLRHFTRVIADAGNPANSCLIPDWRTEWAKFKEHKQPIIARLAIGKDILNIKTQSKMAPDHPPWRIIPTGVDISLAKMIRKKTDDPEDMKRCTTDFIEQYKDGTHIYTDGSKTDDHRTAFGVYIKEAEDGFGARLPNHNTVYAAEICAIMEALRWIKEERPSHLTHKDHYIFSDSLSALQAIEASNVYYTENIITEIHQLNTAISRRGLNVKLIWIPSHVGIQGNEEADRMAKIATTFPADDNIHIPPSRKTAYRAIDNIILKTWQKQYEASSQKTWYKQLEPTVSKQIKYTAKSRLEEITMTRVRFQRCNTRRRLYHLKRTKDDKCTNCPDQKEDLQHFMACPHNRLWDGINIGEPEDQPSAVVGETAEVNANGPTSRSITTADIVMALTNKKEITHRLYVNIAKLGRRM
jgi:ribonuclease HI/exonuclease III